MEVFCFAGEGPQSKEDVEGLFCGCLSVTWTDKGSKMATNSEM